MKYLLLFCFISLSAFLVIFDPLLIDEAHSQEFKTELQEIDKQVYSVERLKALNQMYSQASTFCAHQGFHLDLKALCESEAKKKAQDEFASTLNILVSKKIEDAQLKVTGDASELKKVSYYRGLFESVNVAYETTDTGEQLKVKYNAYLESIKPAPTPTP